MKIYRLSATIDVYSWITYISGEFMYKEDESSQDISPEWLMYRDH